MKGKMGVPMSTIEYSPETLKQIERAIRRSSRQPKGMCEVTVKDRNGNIIRHEIVESPANKYYDEDNYINVKHNNSYNKKKFKKKKKKKRSTHYPYNKVHGNESYLKPFSEETKKFIKECVNNNLTNPYQSCMAVIDRNMDKDRLVILEEWEKINNRKDTLLRRMLSADENIRNEIFDVCYDVKFSRINK